ncbi:chromosome segregation protein SMC, partial [Intestinibacillus massiliensis]|nr:chromosome segregation protein SMC [Intestinibacillus massiliensis]
PEDNLDSQYIYNNLVVQLRETKNERQIIIATHNATIVTNAMSDQVCVMGSDGKHGWVETKGYPSENRIKRNILNYLEGGIDSFKHKAHIYKSVL